MTIEEAIKLWNVNSFDNKLTELYVDSNRIPQEKERYLKAIDSYRAYFGEGEIEIFSAPGRSEIGGNHTDHQHGEVLAASINNDAIAVVKKLEEPFVKVMSDGYSNLITIRLDDLEKKIEEEGSTNALIRGVLAKMKMNGHLIGGFQAYVTKWLRMLTGQRNGCQNTRLQTATFILLYRKKLELYLRKFLRMQEFIREQRKGKLHSKDLLKVYKKGPLHFCEMVLRKNVQFSQNSPFSIYTWYGCSKYSA